jgi:hypothetical protein
MERVLYTGASEVRHLRASLSLRDPTDRFSKPLGIWHGATTAVFYNIQTVGFQGTRCPLVGSAHYVPE